MSKLPAKKITTIRLKDDTLVRLGAAATRRGISRNALIQQVVDQFLRKEARTDAD